MHTDKDYKEYIHSENWKEVRKQAFKAHGKFCARCKTDKNLDVHHKTYKRFKAEDIENDLIPLCRGCHEACHKFIRKININIFHGTEIFLRRGLRTPKGHQKTKKEKWLKSKRKKYWKQINNRRSAIRVSIDEKEFNRRRIEERGSNMVNVERFMQMYNLDEKTAREVLKV